MTFYILKIIYLTYSAKHNINIYNIYNIQYLQFVNEKINMINIGIKTESKNIFPYMWEHAININKYETKKIKPLTHKELESFNNQKNSHICGEELWDKNNNNYRSKSKVRNHWNYICKNRGVAHSIFNLKNKIPKDIPVVFYNDSKYDFDFIIRLLAEKFEG